MPISESLSLSIIIPVYNSKDYVEASIKSAVDQTLPRSEYEIIVVDDGSDDGTDKLLRDLKSSTPNMVLITQTNSGTPGGARNTGMDVARGRYMFFLDSDDALHHDAMRKMVEAADQYGSDVVLGKIASLDHRKVAKSMFKKTIYNANFYDDNVYRSLSPTKLFRTSTVGPSRFPTNVKISEDTAFVAEIYFKSHTFSILTDAPYYYVQYRTDGTNLTLQKSSAQERVLRGWNLAEIVTTNLPPGDHRDTMMKRPFMRLTGIFGWRLLNLGDQEATDLLLDIQSKFSGLFTNNVSLGFSDTDRIALELATSAPPQITKEYVEWRVNNSGNLFKATPNGLCMNVPKSVLYYVGKDKLMVRQPTTDTVLHQSIIARSRVALIMRSRLVHSNLSSDNAYVELISRSKSPEVKTYTASQVVESEQAFTDASLKRVEVDLQSLEPGVWDLFLVQEFGGSQVRQRIGKQRLPEIEDCPTWLTVGRVSGSVKIAVYFTIYGNLSIDVGETRIRPQSSMTIFGPHESSNDGGSMILWHSSLTGTDRPPQREVILERLQLSESFIQEYDAETIATVSVSDDLFRLVRSQLAWNTYDYWQLSIRSDGEIYKTDSPAAVQAAMRTQQLEAHHGEGRAARPGHEVVQYSENFFEVVRHLTSKHDMAIYDIEDLKSRNRKLERKVRNLTRSVRSLTRSLYRVENSRSWKITAPMRRLKFAKAKGLGSK